MDNCNVPPEKRFQKGIGPSKEAQAKAIETRRNSMSLKPYIRKYVNMPYEEFIRAQQDVKENPHLYTMKDVCAMSYVARILKSERIALDHMDRTQGRAPVRQEISGPGGAPIQTESANLNVNMGYQEALTIYRDLASEE